MAEIRTFQNFNAIFKKKVKKSNISETDRVTDILQEIKNVKNDFLYPVDKVYTHLEPRKRGLFEHFTIVF